VLDSTARDFLHHTVRRLEKTGVADEAEDRHIAIEDALARLTLHRASIGLLARKCSGQRTGCRFPGRWKID